MNKALIKPQKQFTLEQAVLAAPSLASLQERIRASQHCMGLIRHLLPETMRRHVSAGPIDDTGWCLLVSNAATSTKLRHLLPVLLQALAQGGQQVSSIRIKVQASPR
jgi:hypothetical protein